MSKVHLKMKPSESVVVQAASRIYAAYIVAGKVVEGEESKWMERSIREAIKISQTTDSLVISDNEVAVG